MSNVNDNIFGNFKGNVPLDSKIIVIGVGGAGCNVVEDMYNIGIHNVMFMVCNTDTLALNRKPIPLKIPLGEKLTEGLGAGANPSIGQQAALESEENIRKILEESGAQMAFITAGMGGGTGTGAAPVIARICREMKILTVGFVTVPQKNEGPRRMNAAIGGLNEMVKYLDSIIIVDNQLIVETYGYLPTSEQFKKANDILAESAKGIAELITIELTVNLDFADVRTTLRDSGITLISCTTTEIKDTNDFVNQCMNEVLNSPLLMQNDISGAKNILVNISWNGRELSGTEVNTVLEVLQEESAVVGGANILYGMGTDINVPEKYLKITVVAADFDNSKDRFGLYKPKEDTSLTSKVNNIVKNITNSIGHKDANSENEIYTQPLNISRQCGERITIKQENIDHIKRMSLTEIEDVPAYKRYKKDVKHIPTKSEKKVVKFE